MNLAEQLLCDPQTLCALPNTVQPLLAWYEAHARILPWRQYPTPYRIWVSEIMLQQTRVEAVKGYYARFLAALPAVADLAAVEEEVLLKLWEGLGYYSRARNMCRAARQIMAEHGGTLPASYKQLRTLPGIGEYTAGAIASIAFGIPVPATDGNVHRVLSRLLNSEADIAKPAVKAALRETEGQLIPCDAPGDFNQAMMELGATVCVPKASPHCSICPLQGYCLAYQRGTVAALPVRTKKKPRKIEYKTVVFLPSEKGIALFQRPNQGLLAGMWEPLVLEGHLTQQEVMQSITAMGAAAIETTALKETKHIFTHVEWRMQGFAVKVDTFAVQDGIWANQADVLKKYAIPSAYRTLLREALQQYPL